MRDFVWGLALLSMVGAGAAMDSHAAEMVQAGSPEAEPNDSPGELGGTVATEAVEVNDIPEAAPVSPDSEVQTQARSEDTFDPRVPQYTQMRPRWAIGVLVSTRALGKAQLQSAQTGVLRALQLQTEYQPAFLQTFGVLSFGGTLSVYPLLPNDSVVSSRLSLWSIGAQVRYQLRYLREQWVVPVVGYQIEQFRYQFQGGPSGLLSLMGPTFGAWLLLNAIDGDSAGDNYSEHGIQRSYLVAELRQVTGSNSDIRVERPGVYFGLRLEY